MNQNVKPWPSRWLGASIVLLVMSAIALGIWLLYAPPFAEIKTRPAKADQPVERSASNVGTLQRSDKRHPAAALGSAHPSKSTTGEKSVLTTPNPVQQWLLTTDVDEREKRLADLVGQGNSVLPLLQQELNSETSLEKLEQISRALAAIGTVESVKVFMDFMFRNENVELRQYLARYLQALQNPEPAEFLLDRLMASTDYDISTCTTECLGRIGDERLVRTLREMYDVRPLSQFQKSFLRAVVENLRNPALTGELADILGKYADEELRKASAQALAHIGTEAAVDALIAAIQTYRELPANHYLISALGTVDNKDSLAYLQDLFDSTDSPIVKYAISTALAHAVPGMKEVVTGSPSPIGSQTNVDAEWPTLEIKEDNKP